MDNENQDKHAVQLPKQPADPLVRLPLAPGFPPDKDAVMQAIEYLQEVRYSAGLVDYDLRCSRSDEYQAVLYQHRVISQAAEMDAGAEVPSWFHLQIQGFQKELSEIHNTINGILPDLRKTMNHFRSEGRGLPYLIVPFKDGTDPTQLPNPLPALHSVDDINNLTGQQLIRYLNGYGIDNLPVDPGNNNQVTNHLQKQLLKDTIGCRFIDNEL